MSSSPRRLDLAPSSPSESVADASVAAAQAEAQAVTAQGGPRSVAAQLGALASSNHGDALSISAQADAAWAAAPSGQAGATDAHAWQSWARTLSLPVRAHLIWASGEGRLSIPSPHPMLGDNPFWGLSALLGRTAGLLDGTLLRAAVQSGTADEPLINAWLHRGSSMGHRAAGMHRSMRGIQPPEIDTSFWQGIAALQAARFLQRLHQYVRDHDQELRGQTLGASAVAGAATPSPAIAQYQAQLQEALVFCVADRPQGWEGEGRQLMARGYDPGLTVDDIPDEAWWQATSWAPRFAEALAGLPAALADLATRGNRPLTLSGQLRELSPLVWQVPDWGEAAEAGLRAAAPLLLAAPETLDLWRGAQAPLATVAPLLGHRTGDPSHGRGATTRAWRLWLEPHLSAGTLPVDLGKRMLDDLAHVLRTQDPRDGALVDLDLVRLLHASPQGRPLLRAWWEDEWREGGRRLAAGSLLRQDWVTLSPPVLDMAERRLWIRDPDRAVREYAIRTLAPPTGDDVDDLDFRQGERPEPSQESSPAGALNTSSARPQRGRR